MSGLYQATNKVWSECISKITGPVYFKKKAGVLTGLETSPQSFNP